MTPERPPVVGDEDCDRASAAKRILVGTASWTDKSLIASGRFYPPKCNMPEDRLRYYSSHFPIVEVDSSYYAIPASRVAQAGAERTPDDFTFNIKAFRLFTGHQTAPAALPKEIADAIPPAGKKNLYYKEVPSELRDELWRRPDSDEARVREELSGNLCRRTGYVGIVRAVLRVLNARRTGAQ